MAGITVPTLLELSVLAKTEGHNRDATWPKAPNALIRRLNELKTNLTAVGIRVSQPRTKAQRIIILSRSEFNSLEETPSSSSSEPTSSHERNIEYGDNDGFLYLLNTNRLRQPINNTIEWRNDDNDDDFWKATIQCIPVQEESFVDLTDNTDRRMLIGNGRARSKGPKRIRLSY